MGSYSFIFLKDGKTDHTQEAKFRDVLDALDFARRLSETDEIEIWTESRFVARLRKNDAPPEVTDRLGG